MKDAKRSVRSLRSLHDWDRADMSRRQACDTTLDAEADWIEIRVWLDVDINKWMSLNDDMFAAAWPDGGHRLPSSLRLKQG